MKFWQYARDCYINMAFLKKIYIEKYNDKESMFYFEEKEPFYIKGSFSNEKGDGEEFIIGRFETYQKAQERLTHIMDSYTI